MAKANNAKKGEHASPMHVPAAKMRTLQIRVTGHAPYVQNAMSKAAIDKMLAAQVAGQKGKKGKERPPRDIEADYKGAIHRTERGKYGIPAPAFRNAMISACRICNLVMTRAKLSIFIEADGFDPVDGMPLVHIVGAPVMHRAPVRLASGVAHIAIRPIWHKWHADVRVRFDEGQFTGSDIANLLHRAGTQVGIGAGRPDSKDSNGVGWGTFTVATKAKELSDGR